MRLGCLYIAQFNLVFAKNVSPSLSLHSEIPFWIMIKIKLIFHLGFSHFRSLDDLLNILIKLRVISRV
jgi:hypothetical protein